MDGGGTHKFFRKELSFEEDIEKTTSLAVEMFICSEYLHITHLEFEKLPWEEKIKWYILVQEKGKREEKKQEEADRKSKERKTENNKDAPQSPGLKT